MALTTLDPITALIVVDLQAGLAGAPFVPSIRRRRDAGPRARPCVSAARTAGRAGQCRRGRTRTNRAAAP